MTPFRFLSTAAGLALAASAPVFAQAPSAPPPQPEFNAASDVAAITAIEDTLATELDIDKVLPFYAEDATVLDLFSPGIFRGRAEIRAGFAPQLAGIAAIRKTTPEITVASNGTFACAISQTAYHTQMKDGKAFDMNVRALDAFKKIDGHWRVVQQHMSFPVNPATMGALTAAPIQPRNLVWSSQPLAPATVTAEAGKAGIREFMDVGGASVGLSKLMTYYGPGDDTLLLDAFSPKTLIGKKEIADFYTPVMGSYTGISLTMPLFVVDSDGSFGIQIDTQHLTLSMKDGSKRNVALRQSDCMRRVGGKWYSFIEMVSYVVDPVTLKAQMGF